MTESAEKSEDGESIVSRGSLNENLSKHFHSSTHCPDDDKPVIRLLELDKNDPRMTFGNKYSVVKEALNDDSVHQNSEISDETKDVEKENDKSPYHSKLSSDEPMRDELGGQRTKGDLVSRVHEVEIPAASSDTISIILKFGNTFKERETKEIATETKSHRTELVTTDTKIVNLKDDNDERTAESVDAPFNFAETVPLVSRENKLEEASSIHGMVIPRIEISETELHHSPNHRSVSAYMERTKIDSASSVRSVDAVTQTKRLGEKKVFSPYRKKTILPKLFDSPRIEKPRVVRKVDEDVRLVLPPLQYYYYGRLSTVEEDPENGTDKSMPTYENLHLPDVRNKFAVESVNEVVESNSAMEGEEQEQFGDVHEDQRIIDSEFDRTSRDHLTASDDSLIDDTHQQKERAIRNFAKLVCDSEFRQGELYLSDESTGYPDFNIHESNSTINQDDPRKRSFVKGAHNKHDELMKHVTHSRHQNFDKPSSNHELIVPIDGEDETKSRIIRWGQEEAIPHITIHSDTEDGECGSTTHEIFNEIANKYENAADRGSNERENWHSRGESYTGNKKEERIGYNDENIEKDDFYDLDDADTSNTRSNLDDTDTGASRTVESAEVLTELKGAVAALGEQRAIMGGQLAVSVGELQRTVRQFADREKMASPATAPPPAPAEPKKEEPKAEAVKPTEETKKEEPPKEVKKEEPPKEVKKEEPLKEVKKEEPTKEVKNEEGKKEEAPQAEGNTPEKKDPDAKSPEPEENGEAPGTPKGASLREQFKAFSKFGDIKSDGKVLTLSQSDKWMKQAKVIDGKTITTTDTAIAFKKFKQMKIGYPDYEKYLQELAKYKNQDAKAIKDKMRTCGTPGTRGTTSVVKGGAFDRLTDTQKYTGSHKQRFDAEGKGKGVAGRKDVDDKSGYVSGYKNKNTYSKTH